MADSLNFVIILIFVCTKPIVIMQIMQINIKITYYKEFNRGV